MTPGTELLVVEVAPIGMVTVELADGGRVALPDDIAASIRVQSDEQATESGEAA
ncbi:MAG: ferrous iron transport protein A [Halobaculum sp.]